MAKLDDVRIGATFHRLTVEGLERRDRIAARGTEWVAICRCECGKTCETRTYALGRNTKSCGCLRLHIITTHGATKKNRRLYHIWHNMVNRCTNPNHQAWADYGGRGVTVCADWMAGPEAFFLWAEQNGYDKRLTLDRRDNDGPYCPENCRWVTLAFQQGNRRNRRMYTAWGETKSASDWLADHRCLVKNRRLINHRVSVYKWPVERAMTEVL